jgi:AMIN domain
MKTSDIDYKARRAARPHLGRHGLARAITRGPAGRRLCVVAAAACLAALASACASQGPSPAAAAGSSSKPHAAASGSKPPAAAEPLPGSGSSHPAGGAPAQPTPSTAATAPVWQEPDLTAIQVGEQAAYDQAVFQFATGIPHYSISYVSAIVQNPNGTPVPLPGRSFLRVTFDPAREASNLPIGPSSYPGPGTISPYFPTLLQISAAGNFEGHLSFGLGLSGRARYQVYTLTNPDRVVIDIPHVTLPAFPGIWDITSWRQFWEVQTAFDNGHQPWLTSPSMVVSAWASGFSSQPTIRQLGPNTFQVTDPVTAKVAIVSGTRPVTTGQAQLWVITSITPVPS